MRHLVKGRKLGRTASHRKATLMALSVALIKSERIVTTLAKAKALRSYVEPIITRSKEDSTHNRSHVFRHLRDKQATTRLFDEIAPMVEDRPGGYTRIIKLGVRPGDGVEKALIELVDFNDAQPETTRKKKRRTRRGGTGGKKGAAKATDTPKETSKSKDAKEAPSKEVSAKKEKAAAGQAKADSAEKSDSIAEAVSEEKKADEKPVDEKPADAKPVDEKVEATAEASGEKNKTGKKEEAAADKKASTATAKAKSEESSEESDEADDSKSSKDKK